MSETTTERETELVAGTIGGITQKKADTWTVAVMVAGLEKPRNLWTKDSELVESLSAKIGQAGSFVCSASYWNHPQHGQVRSLWINSAEEAPVLEDLHIRQNATPSEPAPSQAIAGTAKDRLIVRQTCIKAAAAWHDSNDNITAEDVIATATQFEKWVTTGILDPVPFL